MSKNSADERRSARANVLLAAVIERDGVCTPVRVGNVSAHGALVLCDDLPPEEARVTFRCNGLAIESWIAWVGPPLSGIQFGEPIRPEELRRAPVPHPMVTRDSRKVDHRRPGFRGQQLTDDERQIIEEWRASQ